MRTLLLLCTAALLLVACGGDPADVPDDRALAEPEVPTPPPLEGDSTNLLASLPQEPLPPGVEPVTLLPRPEAGSPTGADAVAGADDSGAETAGVGERMAPDGGGDTAGADAGDGEADASGSAAGAGESKSNGTTSPAKAADGGTGLEIITATMADEVVDRQPVGDPPFRRGREVACYTKIGNPRETLQHIRHDWYHQGVRRRSIRLSVKARSWRTWSEVSVPEAGDWRVDVVDDAGEVLVSLPFVVTE